MSTTPHARQNLRPAAGPRPRRLTVLLLLILLALGAPLGAPADGALAGPVGPIDPGTNFPAYYVDTHGLALQPCLDGPPLCLTTAAETLAPPDGEGFYSAVSATAGGIDLGLDLEMAYFGAGAGQEVVFARTQYSANGGGLVPNGVYTVTDPYGSATCTANAAGAIPNNGCRTDQGGGPRDFTTVLGSRLGPFLTWDTLGDAVGGPPAGYVGDGVTEHRVTGSPTGFNQFRVVGPGVNESTNLFVVSGKLAPGPAAALSAPALDFGNVPAPVTVGVHVSSIGTENLTVLGVSATGPFTAQTDCTTVAPGGGCTINVTFIPVAGQSSTGALQIVDNTLGNPRTIPLAGRSLAVPSLSPAALSFGSRKVGAGRSDPQKVTVRNVGVSALTVLSVTPSLAAYRSTTSGCAALLPGGTCTLRVSFDPSAPGLQPAMVNLATNGAPGALPVTGEGVGLGRPRVVARTPAAGAHLASRRTRVAVRFNERVRHVDRRSFVLTDLATGVRVRGTVTRVAKRSYVLDPDHALAGHHTFRVRLRGGPQEIRDRDGVALKTQAWKFKTR